MNIKRAPFHNDKNSLFKGGIRENLRLSPDADNRGSNTGCRLYCQLFTEQSNFDWVSRIQAALDSRSVFDTVAEAMVFAYRADSQGSLPGSTSPTGLTDIPFSVLPLT